MDIMTAKAVADLIKPITEPLAKRLFEHRGTEGTIVTAALESRLAQVLTTVDISQLSERMTRRSKHMSVRKQLSFENAMSLALELAAQTPEEQRRPVESDWFVRWSEAVQDVTDEMVQSLWAQAFARQTDSESRQISLRVLDTLRLMERTDAVNFLRVADVLRILGYVFVNSNDVIERVIRPDDLDALVDLRLVEFEEQMASVLSAPGGYTMSFYMPPEFTKETFRVIRLSARGRELAQTLPSDQEAHYPYEKAFDLNDLLLVPRYLSLVASNFDRRYDVSLCLYDPADQRPPQGGSKRTHEWDRSNRAWKRLRMPDHSVDPAIIAELERSHDDRGL